MAVRGSNMLDYQEWGVRKCHQRPYVVTPLKFSFNSYIIRVTWYLQR
jgi:hypothetical protein